MFVICRFRGRGFRIHYCVHRAHNTRTHTLTSNLRQAAHTDGNQQILFAYSINESYAALGSQRGPLTLNKRQDSDDRFTDKHLSTMSCTWLPALGCRLTGITRNPFAFKSKVFCPRNGSVLVCLYIVCYRVSCTIK